MVVAAIAWSVAQYFRDTTQLWARSTFSGKMEGTESYSGYTNSFCPAKMYSQTKKPSAKSIIYK